MNIGRGWIYPKGFVGPILIEGYKLTTEYDVFLGLEKRWRYDPI